MDMVNLSARTSLPISVAPRRISDYDSETAAISKALSMVYAAKFPIILVNVLVARHLATSVARDVVGTLKFPTFSTSMGKAIIN